ncbi:UNVERIFIED_CONTAM: E3 ubiquitin-protein ligase [Sesamum angustifolium]|uniref:E3 ubiquitin-protein ligase n=1 Tax=Sesamum angustifolium TaxID=2727405 RepID=A0AAW2PFA8_9LAMI
MNTRYFFTPDSLCNSGSAVSVSSIFPAAVEERIALSSPARSSRTSPPFLIRLAMKISRSRWYSFLRRVFHYQNGSGSDLGPNPFDSKNWMLMEFIALTVQISLTAYILIISKGERPVWPMRIWVVGYAFGCFLNLVLLCWRYRLVYLTRGDNDPSGSDIEQQRSHGESRDFQYMQKCKTSLELLFAIWFVMGNVWCLIRVLLRIIVLLNSMSYASPCWPGMLLLGYNMNTASLQRGATDEQLAGLPSWKYKDAGSVSEPGNSTKNHEVQVEPIHGRYGLARESSV